jgi:hypothetical protein
MAKQTFQMHLYAKEVITFDKEFNEVREVKFGLQAYEDLDFAGSYVRPVEVECEVPENFDIRAAKLRDLQAEQAKVRAEMTKRITELQRQINELQALEMS